jgi:hypothetical protein
MQPINGTAAKETYVLPNIPVQPTPRFCSPLRWLRLWYRYSALRVFLCEIHSLPSRMEYIRKIGAVERLQGPAEVRAWMDGILDSGSQTDKQAGIRYMQHISSRYPFLSIFDRLLLKEAWNAGWVSSALSDTSQSQAGSVNS